MDVVRRIFSEERYKKGADGSASSDLSQTCHRQTDSKIYETRAQPIASRSSFIISFVFLFILSFVFSLSFLLSIGGGDQQINAARVLRYKPACQMHMQCLNVVVGVDGVALW